MGIGLSRLFAASELEDPIVGQDTELANSMGLFLQKTNIIRDYLEDQLEGREFWPKEVKEKEWGMNVSHVPGNSAWLGSEMQWVLTRIYGMCVFYSRIFEQILKHW